MLSRPVEAFLGSLSDDKRIGMQLYAKLILNIHMCMYLCGLLLSECNGAVKNALSKNTCLKTTPEYPLFWFSLFFF